MSAPPQNTLCMQFLEVKRVSALNIGCEIELSSFADRRCATATTVLFSIQCGYELTTYWFERGLAADVFETFLADLIASAAERPVNALEVRRDIDSPNQTGYSSFTCLNARTTRTKPYHT